MKKFFTAIVLSAFLSLSAAHEYKSSGFCAKLWNNGTIDKITWKGKDVVTARIMITAGYKIAKDEKKHDARFFQTSDPKMAKFQQNGDKLTVTVDSFLGNDFKKNAARYEQTITFEPGKIHFKQKITQKIPLQSHWHIFISNMNFPGNIFGRGIRIGEDTFKVIPEIYDPNFDIRGTSLDISIPAGTLSLKAGKNCSFAFMDARSWGANDCNILIRPEAQFFAKEAGTYPVGKVWEWEYTLSFRPSK